MFPFPPPQALETYIGDPDTGVVHRSQAGCLAIDGVLFLDVRTALVRGYRLCACCAAPRPVLGATGGVPAQGRA